jgi:hypothetical protein
MLTYGEAPMAYGLTRGMARVVGVDLVRAVTEGWMSRDELGALVTACTRCGKSADCVAWLAGTAQARALPGYCANKPDLEALRG